MAELALARRHVAEAELEICANQAERVMVLEKIVEATDEAIEYYGNNRSA